MNFPRRHAHELLDEAGNRFEDYADEAAGHADHLLARGRRTARAKARKVAHLAEDVGDHARHQARRARRQVQRHPWATAGAVVLLAGAIVLVCKARHRRHREMLDTPGHDYFGNGDNA